MKKDLFTREWITSNSINIIRLYAPGELTLRGLHYQLVGLGMTNSLQHYKRVVSAMEVARWDGIVPFETFSDLDRTMLGETRAEETILEDKIKQAKNQIGLWMRAYYKNRWENQPIYAELFVEKKALLPICQSVCEENYIGLGAVKGYPSLTFLHEAAERFQDQGATGKKCVILYFEDYDPSGEDIPRSIAENLERMGADVPVKRFALFEDQVRAWKLPPAPTKVTDSRTANWDGIGQVELDAVIGIKGAPFFKRMLQEAIDSVFDYDLYDELRETEETERDEYRTQLKEYIKTL